MTSNLTRILDKHATPIKVTARSKRWKTPEVEAKRKEYERTRRHYQQGRANAFTLRVEKTRTTIPSDGLKDSAEQPLYRGQTRF